MYTAKQQHLMELIDRYARKAAVLTAFLAITGADNDLTILSIEDMQKKRRMEEAKDRAKADLEIAVKMI